MWIAANDAIWAAPMPSSVKIVALAIASHMGDDQQFSWPSESRIATMTGLTKRSVIRNVKWLVDHSCLDIRREIRDGGKWPSNTYRFRNGLKRLGDTVSVGDKVSPPKLPSGDTVPDSGDTVPKGDDTMSH